MRKCAGTHGPPLGYELFGKTPVNVLLEAPLVRN